MKQFTSLFKEKKNVWILVITIALIVLTISIVSISIHKKNSGNDQKIISTTSSSQTTMEETTTVVPTTTPPSETTIAIKETQETTTSKKKEKKPVQTTIQSNEKNPAETPQTSETNKMQRAMQQHGVTNEDEYWKSVKQHEQYKCPNCGKSDCQSIGHNLDVLGNPYSDFYKNDTPCPLIQKGDAKCPHCGKTLVDDDRWISDPDHYCDGMCNVQFG